jgi:hypothetical protein
MILVELGNLREDVKFLTEPNRSEYIDSHSQSKTSILENRRASVWNIPDCEEEITILMEGY